MAVSVTTVAMSVKDIEPVKTFIGEIGAIYEDPSTPAEIRKRIAAACSHLNGGFASLKSSGTDLAEKRGWKIAPEDVAYEPIEQWPSVCIVVPVFNSPALLKQCLISLMRTDYPGELMYTLVDNASTDPETLELLRTRDFTPIRFDEPVGFATAVNAGMRQVSADYYVLFNQDCRVIVEDWLTSIIKWMDHRPQCDVVGPKLVYPFKDGETPRVQHAGITIPEGACARHRFLGAPADSPEVGYFEKVQAVTGAVFAIRGVTLQHVGYLDESYMFGCEDIEFCLRVAARIGGEVWYVPTSTVVHHDHGVRDSNAKASSRIRQWAEQSDKRFRSQWGRFIDRCATESVAFVLPDFNPVAGGCRVVAALANRFITAGVEATIYVTNESHFATDYDLPRLFEIQHISNLKAADTIIATRFDTVEATLDIPASRRFYLVQQIETPMAKYCGATEEDVLRSYRHTEYEIITIGEHLASQLADMGRSSTVFDVGLYVGLYPFKPHQRGKKFRVLMYGSPADYKGGQDAPKIAATLRARFGDAVEVNSFHRDLPKPGWADNHYNPQGTSAVAAIYSDHDVYVYASLSDGCAMTPIEAMACGTPVVLTDFPGKDQYAVDGENCLIAPFRDVGGVAQRVEQLIKSPGTCVSLRKNGRATAEHYDWSRVAAPYAELILGAPSASKDGEVSE